MQTAANSAQPGDHFLVSAGTYAPFTLSTSGTAAAVISFTSMDLHGAIIDGADTDRGIVTLGDFSTVLSHVLIDGFIIEDGAWGVDAQNTQFVTVRNNIIQDVGYGYVNRRDKGNEKDQFITNNLIVGRTFWPQTGIPNERGIDLRGNNNVVSYNTIRDFGDGISTDGPPEEVSYSLDIHNNDIQNIVDDLIEVDGMISNSRIYSNRCFNGRAGVSLAPVYGGPAYVFRNVIFNIENSAFKMNRSPSGMVVVHNTTASDGNAIDSPNGWQNTFYRSNVVLASRYCFEFFGLESDSTDDWDYGAYYSSRSGIGGTEWFKWDNFRYANVTALNASGIVEESAIQLALSDFENAALPAPYPVEYNPADRDFRPMAGSAVVNSGIALGHINEPFVKDGQADRGALEYGESEPQYGAKFDFSSDAYEETAPDNISIYPNPFTDKIIVAGELTSFEIRVFDSLGQQVADYLGTAESLEINLYNLASGLYFLSVMSTNHTPLCLYKLIKE